MNALLRNEIQAIQCDLVILEGMIEVLRDSAYSGTDPALIGNSLEIMKEFVESRTNRLDNIG